MNTNAKAVVVQTTPIDQAPGFDLDWPWGVIRPFSDNTGLARFQGRQYTWHKTRQDAEYAAGQFNLVNARPINLPARARRLGDNQPKRVA